MALPLILPIISALAPTIKSIVGNLFPDPEAKAEAEQQVMAALLAHEAELQSATASIIQAEAKSDHFLTATWRPITMLVFVAIVANNYIVYPYLSLFWPGAPVLDLPPQMWSLLQIGIGGYIASRGVEKFADKWKK